MLNKIVILSTAKDLLATRGIFCPAASRRFFAALRMTGIIFLLCLCFDNAVHASDAEALANSDYQAYKSSPYASSNWDDLVKSGFEAYHSGAFDIAQPNLYKAFNKGCESPIVLFMLALINEYNKSFYSSLEFYQMAQQGFKKANTGHRFNETFYENYGRALYYSGKKDEALPILKQAAKNSKSYWLFKLLGLLAYESGDAPTALSYLERAVRINSPDVTREELVSVYLILAKLFTYQKEEEGALRYYQKVLEVDPNNAEANQFLSGAKKQMDQQNMYKFIEDMKED